MIFIIFTFLIFGGWYVWVKIRGTDMVKVKFDYTTKKTSSFQTILVGDPQIGASKGQTQNGAELTNESGTSNTAAENDGFSWNRTLNTALSEKPDLNFHNSARDQINKTREAKQEE